MFSVQREMKRVTTYWLLIVMVIFSISIQSRPVHADEPFTLIAIAVSLGILAVGIYNATKETCTTVEIVIDPEKEKITETIRHCSLKPSA